MATSVQEVHDLLKTIRPDQVEVIHEMAARRGVSPASMSAKDYRDLIVEEAEFTRQVDDADTEMDAEEQASSLDYTTSLLNLARQITP